MTTYRNKEVKWYEIIKKRRLEMNLTLREVASAIGVTNPTIYNWEQGLTYEPIFFSFMRLLKFLSINPQSVVKAFETYGSHG